MRLLDCGRLHGSIASVSDHDVAAHWVEELIEAINDGRADEVLGRDPRADAMIRLTGPIVARMSEALKMRDARGSRSSSRKKREAG
jgi:hypothetical protein